MVRQVNYAGTFIRHAYGSGGANPLDAYIIGGQSAALVFDRISGVYGLDNAVTTIDAVMPFTRASTATYIDSTGALATAAVDELRTDYDPVTLAMRGVLIEPASTNLLLNSSTLATQTLTVVDATTYTMHFTGTGTITLSGADTTVLTGTGAGEANRVSATFTTVGTNLTVTVSGTVENAQLEAGGAVTSYIPTTIGATTRARDVARINVSDFGFNVVAGTLLIEFESRSTTTMYIAALDGGLGHALAYGVGAGSSVRFLIRDAANNVSAFFQGAAVVADMPMKYAAAWQQDDFALSVDGAPSLTDALGDLFSGVTNLAYGMSDGASQQLNGRIKSLVYYPARLTNADIESWSAP